MFRSCGDTVLCISALVIFALGVSALPVEEGGTPDPIVSLMAQTSVKDHSPNGVLEAEAHGIVDVDTTTQPPVVTPGSPTHGGFNTFQCKTPSDPPINTFQPFSSCAASGSHTWGKYLSCTGAAGGPNCTYLGMTPITDGSGVSGCEALCEANSDCTFFTFIGNCSCGFCAGSERCYMVSGVPNGWGKTGCGGGNRLNDYVSKVKSSIASSIPSVANAGSAMTRAPSLPPTPILSLPPTPVPSEPPTHAPTRTPTEEPTTLPPTTTEPSSNPTQTPTESPTPMPTITPTEVPSSSPPTASPSPPANCQQCYIPQGQSQCVEMSDSETPCIGCTENPHSWHCPTDYPGCMGKICMHTYSGGYNNFSNPPLVVDEGGHLQSVAASSLADCEASCNGRSDCKSFAYCPGDLNLDWTGGNSCYLKDKVLTGSEAAHAVRDCTTYFQTDTS